MSSVKRLAQLRIESMSPKRLHSLHGSMQHIRGLRSGPRAAQKKPQCACDGGGATCDSSAVMYPFGAHWVRRVRVEDRRSDPVAKVLGARRRAQHHPYRAARRNRRVVHLASPGHSIAASARGARARTAPAARVDIIPGVCGLTRGDVGDLHHAGATPVTAITAPCSKPVLVFCGRGCRRSRRRGGGVSSCHIM
jgi:hypothetical protein